MDDQYHQVNYTSAERAANVLFKS